MEVFVCMSMVPGWWLKDEYRFVGKILSWGQWEHPHLNLSEDKRILEIPRLVELLL
jgi:hypothetical protein